MSEAISDMVANVREHLPSLEAGTSAIVDHLPHRTSKRKSVGLIAAIVGIASLAGLFGVFLRRRR